jgi:hypothetical protein
VFLAVATLAAGFIGNYLLARHSITLSQEHWCQALRLLTEHKVKRPINPTTTPSREYSYNLYQTFVQLREAFCHA